MIAVLCCGSCFDEKALVEDNRKNIYTFLDGLLNSKETKVGQKQRQKKHHIFIILQEAFLAI